MSTSYVEAEIVRSGLKMLPFLLIGFIIMAAISSITVMLSAVYFQQASYHKVRRLERSIACASKVCFLIVLDYTRNYSLRLPVYGLGNGAWPHVLLRRSL